MSKMINKKDVIRLLEKIAIYMELKGENPFKIIAFRKAAAGLEKDMRGLSEIETFTDIPGIGKGTAAIIEEYIENGVSETLEQLMAEVPEGLVPLLKLPGLGSKKISRLYKELGIENMESLKKACESNDVSQLKGFGKKTEEKILEAIEQHGTQPERLPVAYMLRVAEKIEQYLQNMPEIEQFSRAGSLRRLRETVKDLDFIIATNEPASVKEQILAIEGIHQEIVAGDTKITLELTGEYMVSVDFRIVKPEEFATALHHFTGSKDHNVKMRQIAKQRGEKISEYGVEQVDTGQVRTFENEAAFYHHFDLPFIPAELRENGSEVDDYYGERLIELQDIKGDLHMHTTWSDGAYTIKEMVEACRAKGYEYMVITDHSQFLKVANGLTEERVRQQIAEIRQVNEEYDDITVLAGIEMDILPDGSLDFSDEVLAELDFVIASIHSSFSQTEEQIMNRLKTACENPYVHMIAHPTGRVIGNRDGYKVDMDQLIELAKRTNTALELNANPQRLDLSYENIKKAKEAGVPIIINTDAHNQSSLDFMKIGISAAKKGYIQQEDVLNTLPLDQLLHILRSKK